MNTVILGSGGVGGYYGALLVRGGNQVTFQARGEHLREMQTRGLKIEMPSETFTLPVTAVDNASNVANAELVIIAVKSYSLGDIASVAKELAERGAVVLPLLNGVDIAERCVELGIPRAALVGGLTRVSVVKEAPGVIVQDATHQEIILGELDGGLSPRAERIASTLHESGMHATATADITTEMWRKFISITSRAAVHGFVRGDVATVLAHRGSMDVLRHAVNEIRDVATARGVTLSESTADEIVASMRQSAGTIKPSFLVDIERGGATEIDTLSGAVSRLGRESGVATPVHDVATMMFSHA